MRIWLDLGKINGEHFAVMAGVGLDGCIMSQVDRDDKERWGRLAYFRSAVSAACEGATRARVRVDGGDWFDAQASCVLLGNIGTVSGGLKVFPEARLDDGALEVGVATAEGIAEWLRVLGAIITGGHDSSPLLQTTRGQKIDIRLARPRPYEMDGGARTPTDRLKIRLKAGAVQVCVPAPDGAHPAQDAAAARLKAILTNGHPMTDLGTRKEDKVYDPEDDQAPSANQLAAALCEDVAALTPGSLDQP